MRSRPASHAPITEPTPASDAADASDGPRLHYHASTRTARLPTPVRVPTVTGDSHTPISTDPDHGYSRSNAPRGLRYETESRVRDGGCGDARVDVEQS